MVYPVTQVSPTATPIGTVKRLARPIVGMDAMRNRHAAAASIERKKTRSFSIIRER